MKNFTRLLVLGLVGALASAGSAVSQTTDPSSEDWPSWAYGFLTPLKEGDLVALPCPLDANPRSCRHPSAPEFEDGIKHSLPDTDLTFTAREADYGYGPADWYPGDHPEMPDIVRYGNEAAGVGRNRDLGRIHFRVVLHGWIVAIRLLCQDALTERVH